jgi:hypothetical protein
MSGGCFDIKHAPVPEGTGHSKQPQCLGDAESRWAGVPRDGACLAIVRVLLDSPYWTTSECPQSGLKSLYPFSTSCTQHHCLRSHLERQDPLFDVLVSNKRDHPIIVLAVGLFIAETADVTCFYGRQTPRAFPVTRNDVYKLPMPSLKSYYPSIARSYPPQKDDIDVETRNQLIQLKLVDPIAVEARQPYRFGLELADYVDNMPNNVIARIVIDTDEGPVESQLFYLFTY